MEFTLCRFQGNEILAVSLEHVSTGFHLTFALPDLAEIVWPDFSAMARKDEIWRSTCLELFLGLEDGSYVEINASPSGAWNCYGFTSYREGMHATEAFTVTRIDCRDSAITVAIETASTPITAGPAVIFEQKDGELNFYAISHAERPDFHAEAIRVHVPANDL